MEAFAVIDTETNWSDEVMSIGTVIADGSTFRTIEGKYHILPKEVAVGGMFAHTLYKATPVSPILCKREEAIADLKRLFQKHKVQRIFAYNASFDYRHLPELQCYHWHDILRLAAYRQYNPKIPATADCCSTGRLRRGFGVEAILRLLSCNCNYHESHNAYHDCLDELEIMRLLRHPISSYPEL